MDLSPCGSCEEAHRAQARWVRGEFYAKAAGLTVDADDGSKNGCPGWLSGKAHPEGDALPQPGRDGRREDKRGSALSQASQELAWVDKDGERQHR